VDSSLKLLLHGIDTLQCAYYLYQEETRDLNFVELLQQREELRLSGQRGGRAISIGGVKFLLSPHGTGSGHPFLLTSENFKIECGEFNEPAFFVTFPSHALWRESAELLHQRFLNWARGVGFVPHQPERVSRVDFAFDYFLPVIDFDEDSFVSRTHKDSQYRENGKIQTFTLGQGHIVLRIYDKVAEIEEQSDKVWFFDLWGQKENVWRIEWQLRKNILRQFRILTLEHLAKYQGDLLLYLCEEYTTLRNRNGDDNRSRWPMHPLWKDLQTRIGNLEQLGVSRIDGKTAALEERMMRYAISLYGYLKAVGAVYCVQNNLDPLPVETAIGHVEGMMHRVHDSMEWRSQIAKRIAEIESGVW
jgi:hypothetical protein